GSEHEYAGTFGLRFVVTGRKVVEKPRTVLRPIKLLRTVGEHFFDVFGYIDTVGFHAFDGIGKPDRIPSFENTYLPSESPLDRVVDLDDRIGDLRNSVRRIDERFRQRCPQKFADAVIAADEGVYPFFEVADLLCRFERYEFRFLLRFVFKRFQVKFEYLAFAFGVLSLLIEAAAGFVPEQVRGQHFFDEFGYQENIAAFV